MIKKSKYMYNWSLSIILPPN